MIAHPGLFNQAPDIAPISASSSKISLVGFEDLQQISGQFSIVSGTAPTQATLMYQFQPTDGGQALPVQIQNLPIGGTDHYSFQISQTDLEKVFGQIPTDTTRPQKVWLLGELCANDGDARWDQKFMLVIARGEPDGTSFSAARPLSFWTGFVK